MWSSHFAPNSHPRESHRGDVPKPDRASVQVRVDTASHVRPFGALAGVPSWADGSARSHRDDVLGDRAVQIVQSRRCGARSIEHLGSAHDEVELVLLLAVAR